MARRSRSGAWEEDEDGDRSGHRPPLGTERLLVRFVTQHTVHSVFGLSSRRYLELLRANPEVPRKKIGRLVLVEVAVLEEKFRPSPPPDAGEERVSSSVTEREPTTPDEVLAALGRRRKRVGQ